jgi:hypothetical protein
MAICLPGMASSVKRAATSATRPAPLVMTTKLMITRIVKHHQADGIVAADQEMPEGFDDLPGGAGPGMPFEQDDARRGDVERQAQQGRDQQHGREDGEIERLHHAHGDQHDDHRNGDIEGEEEIQHKRRQRQDHHRQNQQDQQRTGQLPLPETSEEILQHDGAGA